ncbi:MAG TPA: LptF/LptG family permease [Flavisolibacter sp.]|nr:LptF/LptG family permease [Flavisolibacter sp.]
MITKIDWYILKKFFVTFIFCMLLFTAIAVVVDFSEKADALANTKLGTINIIKQYHFGFIPFIWSMLYPLFVFIAVIFFTSKMALRSEVIAILASGTTYNRWLRPYLIGGVILSVILWFATQYMIPRANEIRYKFEFTYLKGSGGGTEYTTCTNCFYKRIDTNTYVGLKYYDTASKSASSFSMQRLKNNKVVYNIRADRIEWDTTKKNWKLVNVVERQLSDSGEMLRELPVLNLILSLKPSELRRDEFLKDKLTTPELSEYIKLEELRATEGLSPMKVELYRRTATSVTVVLLTLIGAIIAGRKTRGGSGLHLAIGIIIGALFIIADKFSTVFATKGNLHPLIAAWIPNLVFLFVAILLYKKAPK